MLPRSLKKAASLVPSPALTTTILHRSFSHSPTSLSAAKRGSRTTRTVKKSSTAHRPRATEEGAVEAAEAASSSSPPLAATAATPTFPWNAYNAGPTASATGLASPDTALVGDLPATPSIPVVVPHDERGVIDKSTGDVSEKVKKLFAVSAIVVVRQLEMMNVLIGYEEANKYQLLSPEGTLLGYLMEEELGMKGVLTRQLLKTHRAFRATVLDTEGNVLLHIRRPFSWINSRIFVSLPSPTSSSTPDEANEELIIGEAQQEWHLYRRKYNHFVRREGEMDQFGATDSGLMAWDFEVNDVSGQTIGSINRNFAGFGRELFTDTGQYVLRFEGVVADALSALPAPSLEAFPTPSGLTTTGKAESPATPTSVPAVIVPSITYDQRAVMLASAVSIDFDYFTRSRGGIGSGMGMFMPMPMGGTSSTDAGAEGAAGAGMAGGMGGMEGEEGVISNNGEDGAGVGYGGGGYGEGQGGGYGEEQGGGGEVGGGGWSEGGDAMQDPWAAETPSGEEGGTWGWGDLFPSDE